MLGLGKGVLILKKIRVIPREREMIVFAGEPCSYRFTIKLAVFKRQVRCPTFKQVFHNIVPEKIFCQELLSGRMFKEHSGTNKCFLLTTIWTQKEHGP
jgi:hypothetical protein